MQWCAGFSRVLEEWDWGDCVGCMDCVLIVRDFRGLGWGQMCTCCKLWLLSTSCCSKLGWCGGWWKPGSGAGGDVFVGRWYFPRLSVVHA